MKKKIFGRKWTEVVAKPYGLGIANKTPNYHKVEKLKKKFFTQFYEILNQHHGTKYSEDSGKSFWDTGLIYL